MHLMERVGISLVAGLAVKNAKSTRLVDLLPAHAKSEAKVNHGERKLKKEKMRKFIKWIYTNL
jgi:hypothetical protein